jgi:hypothetical protein
LEEEVSAYKAKPIQANFKKDKKGSLGILPIVIIMVLGLAMGFLSPVAIFGK